MHIFLKTKLYGPKEKNGKKSNLPIWSQRNITIVTSYRSTCTTGFHRIHPILSSCRNVRPLSVVCPLLVRFSQGSKVGPRRAKPSPTVALVPWKNVYQKCASLQLKVPRRGEGVFFFAKKPLGGSGNSNGSGAAAANDNDADEGGGSPKRWASFEFGQ